MISFERHPLFFFAKKIKKNIQNSYHATGKQRRLKQAKEEAQEEIEKYRLERDRQFKEFEAKVIDF